MANLQMCDISRETPAIMVGTRYLDLVACQVPETNQTFLTL